MGSVRFRCDRELWFIDYIDATGRRIRETIGSGHENKRLASKILDQREAEAILGQHRVLPAQTPRFGDFADDWLRRQKVRNLAPKTIESYEDAVDVQLRPAFGEQRLGAITLRSVEDFRTRLAETGTRRGKHGKRVPLSPTTIDYKLFVLKYILKDAVERGCLSESPAARLKPLRHSKDRDGDRLQILQPEEIRRLLEVSGEPYRTLYQAGTGTGCRRGELLGLRWSDLDLNRGFLHIRRTRGRVRDGNGYVIREAPLKTRHSRRTIDLGPSLVQVLLALPASDEPDEDHVFRSPLTGGPLDPDNIDRAFKRHLTLASLPEIRFHGLRHTHASLLIAAGVHPKAIQVRMGHASITTTLNIYGHLMPSAFQGVGERLDALLQGTRKAPTGTPENGDARKRLVNMVETSGFEPPTS